MNDADRLSLDPVMRWIVGSHAVTKQAAATSQMGRFETEFLATKKHLVALADLSGEWSKRQARCVYMTRKLAEWPFENGRTENVGPSDGCRGNAVPLAAESKYDFRELGDYLGIVGSNASKTAAWSSCL